MRHRTYAGKIVYLTDGAGEMGRERFRVTVHDDGRRTLRAICEMDDDELLRDVTYTVDRHFRPLDAFVRLTIGEAFVGSGWYHFTETAVTCEAVTASAGRVSYRRSIDGRPPSLGAHPICCDTWHSAAAFSADPVLGRKTLGGVIMTSHLPNGGSGPEIGTVDLRVEYHGDEGVSTPAGQFTTRHFANQRADAAPGRPPVEVWAYSDDFIPARLRWDLLGQTYELVELDHTGA